MADLRGRDDTAKRNSVSRVHPCTVLVCCVLGAWNAPYSCSLKATPPGVARQLVTFFCVAKKKVTQEKAPPVCRPCGVPCVARLVRRLRNSRYALTNLRYSAAHRGKQNPKTLKS